MEEINLFGEMQEYPEPDATFSNMSSYQKFKVSSHYRKATGERRCKNCTHHITMRYHDKNYHKCELIGTSNSEATDIRLFNVCDEYSKTA